MFELIYADPEFKRSLLRACGYTAMFFFCFALWLSIALTFCIVPLLLGISSFASLLVKVYTSFYLLNCIAHVWQVIWVSQNNLGFSFLVWWPRLEQTVKKIVGGCAVC